jgi:hypothetical protein
MPSLRPSGQTDVATPSSPSCPGRQGRAHRVISSNPFFFAASSQLNRVVPLRRDEAYLFTIAVFTIAADAATHARRTLLSRIACPMRTVFEDPARCVVPRPERALTRRRVRCVYSISTWRHVLRAARQRIQLCAVGPAGILRDALLQASPSEMFQAEKEAAHEDAP